MGCAKCFNSKKSSFHLRLNLNVCADNIKARRLSFTVTFVAHLNLNYLLNVVDIDSSIRQYAIWSPKIFQMHVHYVPKTNYFHYFKFK